MLTNTQFSRSQKLALQLAGIALIERHAEFLCRRMRRVGIVELAQIDALLDAVENDDPQGKLQFLGLVTTNFTGFWRHPGHFEIAADRALRAAEQRGQARLWSAAAATGEEPYSLAVALIEAFQPQEPAATILATDIDAGALAFAHAGHFSEPALRVFDPLRRGRFFVQTSVAGRWSVAPALRRLVEFRPLNLAGANWPVKGPFDVIFCRNVLMYLETRCRESALERMVDLLAPDGIIILDPTEHAGSVGHLFTLVMDGVYSLRRGLLPAARRGMVARPPASLARGS